MNFMQLLQTLDELLYEVMSWIVFFPITLWRTITRPLQMMRYADTELQDSPEDQYEDTLTPPLFLLLALLLSHGLELSQSSAVNPIVASNRGLAALIDSDGKLLLLRLAFFSVIPLMLATAMLVGRRQQITRTRLKPPFYAQCYPAGAFALTLGIGTILAAAWSGAASHFGAILVVAALAGYFGVQVAWFRRNLGKHTMTAAAYALISVFGGSLLAILAAYLVL